MKAIIENGGLKIEGEPTVYEVKALLLFNSYLNAIELSENAEDLKKEAFSIESGLRQRQKDNPFTSGFTEEGFEVYRTDYSKFAKMGRLIFVECETDIEM